MKTTFPALPRDARDAAAKGFDVTAGSPSFHFDFPDGATMLLKGEMDVDGPNRSRIQMPFTAEYKFGEPVAAKG